MSETKENNKRPPLKQFKYSIELETVFNETAQQLGMSKTFHNRGFLNAYALAVQKVLAKELPSLSEIENLVTTQVNAKLQELQSTIKPYQPEPETQEPIVEKVEDPYKETQVEDNGFNEQMKPTQAEVKTPKKWTQEEGWHNEEPKKESRSTQGIDWVVCPTQDDWVDRNSECELCKTEHYEVYKECFRKRVADPFGPLFTIETPKPS